MTKPILATGGSEAVELWIPMIKRDWTLIGAGCALTLAFRSARKRADPHRTVWIRLHLPGARVLAPRAPRSTEGAELKFCPFVWFVFFVVITSGSYSREIAPAFSKGCSPCCASAGAPVSGNIFPGFAMPNGSNAARTRFKQSISSGENISGR